MAEPWCATRLPPAAVQSVVAAQQAAYERCSDLAQNLASEFAHVREAHVVAGGPGVATPCSCARRLFCAVQQWHRTRAFHSTAGLCLHGQLSVCPSKLPASAALFEGRSTPSRLPMPSCQGDLISKLLPEGGVVDALKQAAGMGIKAILPKN